MYPNITLQIRKHIPSLVYHKSEKESKKMTLVEENLLNLISKLAKDLNLIDPSEVVQEDMFAELLDLARGSDETYIVDYPEIEDEGIEFNLENAIKTFQDKNKVSNEYEDLEMDSNVRDELNRNQNADIFASALDYLYMTMVAKALLAGSEMGLGIIRLDDDSKNTRLQEKMAMELERMGVDFVVE